jgi:universal stress protein A
MKLKSKTRPVLTEGNRKTALTPTATTRAKPGQPLRPKTVLVAMDFSEDSKRALAYAASMAQGLGAELILLHVVESFPIDRFISPETLAAEYSARLEGAKRELQSLSEGFRDKGCIRRPNLARVGKPYQVVVETAQETGADLIVLGSHGYTGLKRVYLGSTAERVVRHAPCAVLVIRE